MYKVSWNADASFEKQERSRQLRQKEENRDDQSFRYLVFGLFTVRDDYRIVPISQK